MESDFIEAWSSHFSLKKSHLTETQIAVHDKFALSNRERGKKFLEQVRSHLDFDFQGKKILDIGSAYGGFVIMCSEFGAEAYGVEILADLHNLALANALNESGQIHLINANILDDSSLQLLNHQTFDLIILNDVFEHIYDSSSLFEKINQLSHPETIVYFAIPNGDSYHSIINEGHKFIFGLTLLEPNLWSKAVNWFNIYYRPLDYYRALFQFRGFKFLYLFAEENRIAASPKRVKTEFSKIRNKLGCKPFDSSDLNESARRQFDILSQRLENDLQKTNPVKIHLQYEQHFWTGFASKTENLQLKNADNFVSLPACSVDCEFIKSDTKSKKTIYFTKKAKQHFRNFFDFIFRGTDSR